MRILPVVGHGAIVLHQGGRDPVTVTEVAGDRVVVVDDGGAPTAFRLHPKTAQFVAEDDPPYGRRLLLLGREVS